MTRPSLASLLACVLLASSGCGDSRTAAGTGVFLYVEWDTDTDVDQLRIQPQLEGAAPMPVISRPEPRSGTPLESPQTLRLQFSDDLDGKLVLFEVDGYDRTTRVLRGSTAALLEQGRESDAVVVLE